MGETTGLGASTLRLVQKAHGDPGGKPGRVLGVWGGVQSSAQVGEASPTCGQEASEVLGTDKVSVQRQEAQPLPCGLFPEQVGVWSLGGSWGGSSCERDRERGSTRAGEAACGRGVLWAWPKKQAGQEVLDRG